MQQQVSELEETHSARQPTPAQSPGKGQPHGELEEAILTAAQQWRATFDALHDAVCLLDATGRILRCNRAMVEFCGKPYDEILDHTCYELVHGLTEPIAECPTARARVTGRRESVIQRVGDRWLSFVADPVLDQNGEATSVVHIISDITERMRTEGELRRRNHELTLLNQIAHACSSTLSPTQVLFTVLEETCNLLDVVSSSIWLIDRETGELVCQDATGPNRETLRNWRLPIGQGIVGEVAANGESLIVPDTRADDRHYAGVDQTTGLQLRSIVGVPLKVQQRVIGVLEVVDPQVDRFDGADLRLLEPLAATAATAFENARLYEQARLEIAERRRAEAEREQVIRELQSALQEVQTLSGLLPMCAGCKKIRDDQGYWQQVEVYIRNHSQADFSHGLCPDCAQKLYPDIFTEEDF